LPGLVRSFTVYFEL